jgi:pSer/pThr/pTyr-binding forkhead associated (FHA) protein
MGVLKTKRGGQLVTIPLSSPAVTVGSGAKCLIVVGDGAPQHCQILKTDRGFLVRDLSGETGTFVNGKRIKEHSFSEGDILQVGSEKFTYGANPSGNTTGRIRAAVPVPAPVVARSGNTGRIVVAGNPNGAKTERTAIRPAAVAVSSKTTGRIEKVVGTGRVTRRVTSRRIPAKAPMFQMPTTRKGRMIALGVVLGILALGGSMLLILSGRDNPEEIKANLVKDIQALNAIPQEEIGRKADRIREILLDEKYKKYGAELRLQLAKEAPKVYELERIYKEADKEVKPYLAKYNLAKGNAESYDKAARDLYDEVKSLIGKYDTTPHGDELKRIRDELTKVLESKGKDKWQEKIVQLQAEVLKAENKGDFIAAAKIVDEFGTRYKQKDDSALYDKLKNIRESWPKKSDVYVGRLQKSSEQLIGEGKKAEALRTLEVAREGLKGLSGEKKLDQVIRAFKEQK